ncbi:MAG: EAL domain-containing protein, partial [Solobacterium sp.]|nr:EAL domain-containing protein [Solobacterium sp.]
LESYKRVIEEKITVEGCDLFLTSNTGYAEFPTDGADSDTLLACAQTALNTAKKSGASAQISRYTSELMSAEKDLELEQKIRSAMENGRLFYYLQPQFDIDHKIRGFEVLARMKDADGSMISPMDFIPAAERMGIIDQVDYTVFRSSAMFFGELVRKTNADITLSINVSVKHMMKNDFLEEIRSVLRESGIPANQLEIEITESIMIDSVEKALRCIDEIRRMGVKLAIDDFGTGYSSLSYLNNFPSNLLKVDKSFVDQMNTSETSRKYVAAIISMGHVMNFDVIAEGVEENEQLETLRSIGCDYIQGYYWGRPMPPEKAAELVLKAQA